ncbi:unnamed protein product [Gulo gulo]|uniref:Uncharacterized protein n=1 Tax=Gulo gulo TaxID=48420 RepID=A0A9X9Q600_GULGU|nr:unnamed protein product [Gulo gulo]
MYLDCDSTRRLSYPPLLEYDSDSLLWKLPHWLNPRGSPGELSPDDSVLQGQLLEKDGG